MQMKVGNRLRSVVCDTEVIVVRAPSGDLELRCGGHPMVAKDDAPPTPNGELSSDMAGGSEMGKRYADDDLGLEVLVTKPGAGTLSVAGEPLPPKDAKKLPTSD